MIFTIKRTILKHRNALISVRDKEIACSWYARLLNKLVQSIISWTLKFKVDIILRGARGNGTVIFKKKKKPYALYNILYHIFNVSFHKYIE